MLINSRALQVVTDQCPTERPLDAGPARCSYLAEELGRLMGSRQGADEDLATTLALNELEAEWVATDSALLYVWPDAGLLCRLSWSDVESVSLGRPSRVAPVRGGKIRTVTLRTGSGQAIEVETGAMAAKALRKIAKSHL